MNGKSLSLVTTLAALLLMLVVGLPAATAAERSYPGTILAGQSAELAFRVGGPLVAVKVRPGDTVRKGDLLLQIDPRDYSDNISVLKAQLEGIKAQRDRAEKDYERARTLFEQQVSASSDFDLAQSILASTVAGVHTLEAQLQIARHHLDDTSLKSPFDGVITFRRVENHEMVSPGKIVIGVQEIANLDVEIKVPESDLTAFKLQRGEPARVRLISAPEQVFPATLKEWQTTADPLTRTYLLRFSFTAPETFTVLPGMTAEVLH
ncbi:MAG: hypothetical protein C0622_11365 [Desulfuromonas sp.]|nr:MAG: hypothetical protein C0622_11365 [Desulfuromonas sp.]